MNITLPKEKIVIIGFGWVGQANALALSRMGYSVSFYDVVTPKFHYIDTYRPLYESLRSLENPLEIDSPDTWYIVSIGDRVHENGFQDISLIQKALEALRGAQGKVMLRSTVLPHYLVDLHFDIYFPEFLHEFKAIEECIAPHFFVLGVRGEIELPSFLKEWEERAYRIFRGTPEEASHIKYLSNIWNAVRVAFVNEFGDSIATPISSAKRQEVEKVLDFVLERKSYLRYGQGFGGHCLPKDLRAYAALQVQKGKAVPLFMGAQESNLRHEEIVQRYQTLPQWFSFWEENRGGFRLLSPLQRWWRRINETKLVRPLRQRLKPMRAIERLLPKKTLPKLKSFWNISAQKNPYYYSHSDLLSGRKADEYEFRESGERDYAKLVAEDAFLVQNLGNFNEKIALEIGSGAGRITEFFADYFKHIHGIDISTSMLATAKKRLFAKTNVTFIETEGDSIAIADSIVDFVFSYLVFKHLPSLIFIRNYFKEIKRVLKPGGIAKIHMRTGPAVHPWDWFYGVSLTPKEAEEIVKEVGLDLITYKVENVKDLWLWIKKSTN